MNMMNIGYAGLAAGKIFSLILTIIIAVILISIARRIFKTFEKRPSKIGWWFSTSGFTKRPYNGSKYSIRAVFFSR